jgi:hypothetical protein
MLPRQLRSVGSVVCLAPPLGEFCAEDSNLAFCHATEVFGRVFIALQPINNVREFSVGQRTGVRE